MLQEHPSIKFMYLILDLLLLNLAVLVVFLFSPVFEYMDLPQKKIYFLHANISEMIAYMLYSRRNIFLTDKLSERIKWRSKRFIILIVVLFLLAELILPKGYHRKLLVEYVILFYVFKTVAFLFTYRVQKQRYNKENFGHRVAILGSGNSSRILGNLLEFNPKLGFKMAGYISDDENCDKNQYLGCKSELSELAQDHKINMVFVTNPKYFTAKNTKKLLALCNETGLRIRYILMNGYWESNVPTKADASSFFEMYNPQEIPLDHISSRMQKRAFDIMFSLFITIFILSWLIPIVAIIIKLESRGPVFFLQERTGINNKTFKCLKLRTMKVNKDSDTKQAQINDARITKFGEFLRKSSIDELPQFFNVLLGHMSIVGPRPHMLKHTDQYSELIKHYKVRHFVKPGITGWAQVNGFRGITDELWKMEKRVEYDMKYLDKWSFLWDLKIVFMTVLGKDTFKNAM